MNFADGVLRFTQNPIKPKDLISLDVYQKRVLDAPIIDDNGKPIHRSQ